MIIKRTFCVLFLLFSVFSWQNLKAQTFHVSHDISTGSLTIPGSGNTNNYEIYGSTTINRVLIESGYEGTIKFKNLSMIYTSSTSTPYTPAYSPVTVRGEYNRSNLNPITKVTIVLEGNNRLEYRSSVTEIGWCALQVDQGAQIHLRAVDENDNTSGSLSALIRNRAGTAGYNGGGAAIGAPIYQGRSSGNEGNQGRATLYNENGVATGATGITAGGNVIISSGTISAFGGHGAGIGGGYRNYYSGIIVVYGGVVDVKSFRHAAGIGSGCPTGIGVIKTYTANSAIVALPPATIEGYGAGGAGGQVQIDTLALAGAGTIIYVNDPNKPEVTVRTVDNEPKADIYADLTETPELVFIFDTLKIDYNLSAAKFGTTDASGLLKFHAQLDKHVTFFTDASSSNPANLGRPYAPVRTLIPSSPKKQEVVLPLVMIDISMEIEEALSRPLPLGYTQAEAEGKAYRVKITYNDNDDMTGIVYELQNGATSDFAGIKFFRADGTTPRSAPVNLTKGDVFYMSVPLKTGKPIQAYRDVLRFNGTWKGSSTGWMRLVVEQRVVLDDTGENKYIKVTATPPQKVITKPETEKIDLKLNITHSGLSYIYDPGDVIAKYIITPYKEYEDAVADTPVNLWNNLNIPPTDGATALTQTSLAGKTTGRYYIHWFVLSGLVYAHSEDVTSPPKTYGGFGPYSIAGLNNDVATVFEYGSTVIDILDNDELPFEITSALSLVTEQSKSGTLTSFGKQLIYEAKKASLLTHNIDSFTYRVNAGGGTYLTAKARIYVIPVEEGGFVAVKGTNHTVRLGGTQVAYSWYDELLNLLGTSMSRTINNINSDHALWISPKRTAEPYRNLEFPKAKMDIKVLDATESPTMRWTGNIDTDWHNPGNWAMVIEGQDRPVPWIPNSSIHAIIPSGAPNYPQLERAGACNDIRLEDRAMIASIHCLTYSNASVEIKLQASEKNRFIMWSAPLKSMYSGDYHYTNSSNQIQWGDGYMNLFQHASPVGGPAAANTFTTTFGELDEPLELGKGFNLLITSTSNNKDKTFTFPLQSEDTYMDAQGTSYPRVGEPGNDGSGEFIRTDGSRFITDGVSYDSNYIFDMPVANDVAGSNLVQVVNPYMAYLDMSYFLEANKDKLTGSYVIWNGRITDDFEHIGSFKEGESYRYKISNLPSSPFTEFIPPLQSFFIQKKSDGAIHTVKMSPRWTSTSVGENPYVLRSETDKETEKNIFRIKATQGNKTSHTVLFYHSAATHVYDSSEDMYKLSFDEVPLEIYSLTAEGKAMAINSMDDFSQGVDLGLRVKEAGIVKLDFEQLKGFNHKVYLIDNELKGRDREIDLQKTSSYTFAAAKPANTNGTFFELNNRFSLRFDYNPVSVEEVTADKDLMVNAKDGYLYISMSDNREISRAKVYDMQGVLVGSSTAAAESFRIPVQRQKIYLVKVVSGEKEYSKKVIVN